MRAQYDFSKMKGEKNPYRARLKQPIIIRLDKATVAYFKGLATDIGMPYQNLINLSVLAGLRLPSEKTRSQVSLIKSRDSGSIRFVPRTPLAHSGREGGA